MMALVRFMPRRWRSAVVMSTPPKPPLPCATLSAAAVGDSSAVSW